MDAFIFNADIYCPACAAKIKAALDAQGKTPAQPDDERTFDSDEYPKGPFDNGGGESDTPQHCGDCGVYLDAPLTTSGVDYAIEHLQSYVDRDSGTAEVLDIWAADLKDYSLDAAQQATLDAFTSKREGETVEAK